MNKYSVSLIYSADWGVDVQANSPQEAAEQAYNSEEASVSVCHQCAGSVNIGDCIRVIVYDESGSEVFDDGYEHTKIAELTAERDALAQENKRLRDALCDFYSAWTAGRNAVAVSAIETARPLYEQALATVKEKP